MIPCAKQAASDDGLIYGSMLVLKLVLVPVLMLVLVAAHLKTRRNVGGATMNRSVQKRGDRREAKQNIQKSGMALQSNSRQPHTQNFVQKKKRARCTNVDERIQCSAVRYSDPLLHWRHGKHACSVLVLNCTVLNNCRLAAQRGRKDAKNSREAPWMQLKINTVNDSLTIL